MKTLKTKKINVAIIHAAMKKIPPKSFSTIGDMEAYIDGIRPKMEEHMKEYDALYDESRSLLADYRAEKISREEFEKKMKGLSEKNIKLDEQADKEDIEIEFEDAPFSVLFEMFGQFGKDSFGTVDSYVAFKKDLDKANSKKE